MSGSGVREYTVDARSTHVFGRVMTSARDQHLVVDGPVQNGCPGEAITPGELFLGGVASCGVELIEVIAREREIPLGGVAATIYGLVDRDHPVHPSLTVFNRVRIDLTLRGVDQAAAGELVEGFQGRCPLYGTVAASVPDVQVEWKVEP